mmetsp:Transcript_10561/g.11616  ORF Transcript_10561/g.11616 Transcript_10561/m.11616 type:complete len:312 (+) Transcript_10561:1052-1987(+)
MNVQTGIRPHDPFAYDAHAVNYAAGVLLSIKQAPDAFESLTTSSSIVRKPSPLAVAFKRKHSQICSETTDYQTRNKRVRSLKDIQVSLPVSESAQVAHRQVVLPRESEFEEEHSSDSDNSGDYVPKESQGVVKRQNKAASSTQSGQNSHFIETKEVLVPEDIRLFLGKSREPVLEALLMCIVYGLACRQLADNRYLIEDHDLLHDYISLFAGSKANQTNSRVNRNKTLKSRWFKMPSGRKPKSFVIETYPERVKDVERKKREVTRKVGDKSNPRRIKVGGTWKTFTPPTPDQLRNILQRNTRINVKLVSST